MGGKRGAKKDDDSSQVLNEKKPKLDLNQSQKVNFIRVVVYDSISHSSFYLS